MRKYRDNDEFASTLIEIGGMDTDSQLLSTRWVRKGWFTDGNLENRVCEEYIYSPSVGEKKLSHLDLTSYILPRARCKVCSES